MSKDRQQADWPGWCAPPEVLGLLGTAMPGVVVIPLMMIFAVICPLLNRNLSILYLAGLGVGFLGIVLLFFARLPLYRQRRFWTFGPKALDRTHRRLYWLAYALVAMSILLLLAFMMLAN